MAMLTRWGLSLPLPGMPLGQQRELVQAAEQRWSGNEHLYGELWERWAAGNRREAVGTLSEAPSDHLVAIGAVVHCRAFME